jgi:hypothetical protein
MATIKKAARREPVAKKATKKKETRKRVVGSVAAKKVVRRKTASKAVDPATGLTDGQIQFALNVHSGMKRVEAALAAGYSNNKGLEAFASRLAALPAVARFLQALKERQLQRKVEDTVCTKQELLEWWSRGVRFKGEIDDDDAKDLLERKRIMTEDGMRIEETLISKREAAKEIARLEDFYPSEKVDVSVISDTEESWSDKLQSSPKLAEKVLEMLQP